MRGEGDSKDSLGFIGKDLFPRSYTKIKLSSLSVGWLLLPFLFQEPIYLHVS